PHFTVIGPGIPGGGPAVVLSSPNLWYQWVSNDPASAWIGWRDSGDTQPYGDYTYELTFDLSGYDPSSVTLSGNWAADQFGSITLNGADTGVFVYDGNWDSYYYPNLSPFTITSGFQPGLNRLDFIVNEPDGFDALRVRGLTLNVLPMTPA